MSNDPLEIPCVEIPCLVDHETREEVIDYGADNVKNGMIMVELGVYLGGTISRLALRTKSQKKKVDIYAIDNWRYDNISQASLDWSHLPNKESGFGQFKQNIADLDLEKDIKVVISDTVSAAEMFEDKSVNYLFMDASHTYEGLREELRAWMPKMADKCLLAIHDWPDNNIYRCVIDNFGEPARIVTGGSSAILIDTLKKKDKDVTTILNDRVL